MMDRRMNFLWEKKKKKIHSSVHHFCGIDLHKVTDEEGTATEKETIMEKVKGFYQKLYKKRNLCNNYGEFLDNVPKIRPATRIRFRTPKQMEA